MFGNDGFRENQKEIINAVKSKRDALALIPTGGGKSLTFQLTAVTGSGVTFVVMPLISLIEDNLNYVLSLGISACSLSAGSKTNVNKKLWHYFDEIRALKYKIVYLTPEKLAQSEGLLSTMIGLYNCDKIDLIAIDEVHCMSSWGQDFRKDYL